MRVQADADPLRGAIAGLAAGLAASLVMDLFQKAVSALSSDDEQGDGDASEPATVKAADKLACATTGAAMPEQAKPIAGQGVHYAFGAALGVAYGVAAEYLPETTTGAGTLFGATSALLFDEAAVPALGLGSAPWEAPASTHLYALGSHLVFGLATETTRRLVRQAL